MWTIENDLTTQTIGGVADVVTSVNWRFTKSSGSNTVTIPGTCELPYDPASPFIEYASLTEEVVLSWVKGTLGADAVTFYETKADEILSNFQRRGWENRSIITFVTYSPEPSTVTKSTPWA